MVLGNIYVIFSGKISINIDYKISFNIWLVLHLTYKCLFCIKFRCWVVWSIRIFFWMFSIIMLWCWFYQSTCFNIQIKNRIYLFWPLGIFEKWIKCYELQGFWKKERSKRLSKFDKSKEYKSKEYERENYIILLHAYIIFLERGPPFTDTTDDGFDNFLYF